MIFRKFKDFVIADFKNYLLTNAIVVPENEESADKILITYINWRFPALTFSLNVDELQQFIDELHLPLFNHKREKCLPFLKRFNKQDFTIITDVCDNFSK